uniref:Man1/Src1-like C-terminal domain-containing protein n=1 Tax=Eptatretus burgeri TaxID=7764 RepID=A0A8C4WU00_EPTBU
MSARGKTALYECHCSCASLSAKSSPLPPSTINCFTVSVPLLFDESFICCSQVAPCVSGNYQCGYSNSSQISLADLKKMDDFQGYNDDMLKTLMTGTYKDNFIITGENGKPVDSFEKVVFLESPFSQKSILCRIHTALCKVIFRLLCMFVGFAVIWALVLYIRFWLKQREELRKQAFDLVDRIAALLQAQAEESQTVSFMEPYMSVLHVRDSLIQPRDRFFPTSLFFVPVTFSSNFFISFFFSSQFSLLILILAFSSLSSLLLSIPLFRYLSLRKNELLQKVFCKAHLAATGWDRGSGSSG